VSPPSDDAELVAAAQGGDGDALDTLLRRHHPAVHGLCRRLTGNAADADDATQDALIAIVRGLPRFDGRAAFSSWAYRVATNACLDELRRRGRRPVPVDVDPDAGPAGRRATGPNLDQAVADRLTLDEALVALPPDYRAAVVLRDQLGLDYASIAEVLEVPPGTVRSRIARGRAALAAALGGNQPAPTDVGTETP
jgi:RNA polymerase sigma-70 factor, ECF subfamily